MKNALLTALVLLFCAAHQDFWFWRTARPLVFGFLPIGLFYHACYSLAAAGLIGLLVRFAWPGHLETDRLDTDEIMGLQKAWRPIIVALTKIKRGHHVLKQYPHAPLFDVIHD